MNIALELAKEEDAAAIAALRLAAARELGAKFGEGPWSLASDTIERVALESRGGNLYLARRDGVVLATLRLLSNNPWIGETKFFPRRERPVFLTSMAVSPAHQRTGVGRACIEDVMRLARLRGADAVQLDSFDAPAGAGGFYRRCGFREVHRGDYLGVPLVWLEREVK